VLSGDAGGLAGVPPPAGQECSSAVLGAIAIARFCVLVKVSCSFGMIVFVARNCIQTIVMPPGKQFTKRSVPSAHLRSRP